MPGRPGRDRSDGHDVVVLFGESRPPFPPGEERPHPGSSSQYAPDSWINEQVSSCRVGSRIGADHQVPRER